MTMTVRTTTVVVTGVTTEGLPTGCFSGFLMALLYKVGRSPRQVKTVFPPEREEGRRATMPATPGKDRFDNSRHLCSCMQKPCQTRLRIFGSVSFASQPGMQQALGAMN
jgi:hypothetical protein